jgi:hypothetical protein
MPLEAPLVTIVLPCQLFIAAGLPFQTTLPII